MKKIKALSLFTALIVICGFLSAFDNPDNLRFYTDLQLTGKIWGFLKYHHPAVTNGNYDWDAELFKILDRITAIDSTEERNETLYRWIDSLGGLSSKTKRNDPRKQVKMKPDNDWIRDTVLLGSRLSQKLSEIENQSRKEKQYYVNFDKNEGVPAFTNEKNYRECELTDEYKLLALFRYWNWFNYFYPYRYNFADWDTKLLEYIPEFINAENPQEYRDVICRLGAEINDTHIKVMESDRNERDTVLTNLYGRNAIPAIIDIIGGHAVVTGYFNRGKAAVNNLSIGDEILKINGKDISLLITEQENRVSASNPQAKLRSIADKIIRTNNDVIDLFIRRGEDYISLSAKCYPCDELNVTSGRVHLDKQNCFLAADSIGYIYIGNLSKDDLRSALDSFRAKTKGIIVDARGYPVDDIFDGLLNFFPPGKEEDLKFTLADFNSPGQFFYSRDKFEKTKKNRRNYNGKLIILVNENTQSAAETLVMYLSQYPHAITIGSQSAGANGGVIASILPGNVHVTIPVYGIYYPDGKEIQGIGVHIDEYVFPVYDKISGDHDILIERAISIINRH